MKLLNILLITLAFFSINVYASINDKKKFDSEFPAKYDNTAGQLYTEVIKIKEIKELSSDTPFIEVATSDKSPSVKIPTPKYPDLYADFEDMGYTPKSNKTPLRDSWFSLSPNPNWSLDDSEAYSQYMETFPEESDWNSAELLPKGREIRIYFIIMDAPQLKKLGKFRTYYYYKSYHADIGKLMHAAYKREQAKAEKAIADAVPFGYAYVRLKEGKTEKGGWVRLADVVQKGKGKGKKKRK